MRLLDGVCKPGYNRLRGSVYYAGILAHNFIIVLFGGVFRPAMWLRGSDYMPGYIRLVSF